MQNLKTKQTSRSRRVPVLAKPLEEPQLWGVTPSHPGENFWGSGSLDVFFSATLRTRGALCHFLFPLVQPCPGSIAVSRPETGRVEASAPRDSRTAASQLRASAPWPRWLSLLVPLPSRPSQAQGASSPGRRGSSGAGQNTKKSPLQSGQKRSGASWRLNPALVGAESLAGWWERHKRARDRPAGGGK